MHDGLRYVELAKTVNFEVSNVVESGTENLSTQPQAYCGVEYEYFNGLAKPVTIVDRSGLQIEISPSRSPMIHNLIIRAVLVVGRDVNLNIDRLLNSTSEETKLLVQIIKEGRSEYRYGQCRYSLDFQITLDDLDSRGGNLYLTNLDKVVSTLQGHLVSPHPYSEVGVRNNLVENDPTINDVDSFGYSLRIVDSEGRYGDRFVNINKEVYKVPVVRSSALQDGVYLTSSGPVTGDYNLPKPFSQRFTFEEADEKLRLYNTVEQARVHGDEMAEKKKELEELSLKVKRDEHEMKQEKARREAEFEKRKQELEEEKNRADHERKAEEHRLAQKQARLKEEISELEHRRNIEMIKRKDQYEERSHKRKDTSEVVKYLPAIFTGLLALFVAIDKARK